VSLRHKLKKREEVIRAEFKNYDVRR